jgi:hypothetical protein
MRSFGSPGSGLNELWVPTGIREVSGCINIADTGNHRIVTWGGAGEVWKVPDEAGAFSFVDVGPPYCCHWVLALDGAGSRLVSYGYPDAVLPVTWGTIKALYRAPGEESQAP